MIYHCNNRDCLVSYFQSSTEDKDALVCPQCNRSKISDISFDEGVEEWFCRNTNCPEYQIKPYLDTRGIFRCPFCHSTLIEKGTHDII